MKLFLHLQVVQPTCLAKLAYFGGQPSLSTLLSLFLYSVKKLAPPAVASAKAGAGGRTRTDTVLLPRDFESRASAISPPRRMISRIC